MIKCGYICRFCPLILAKDVFLDKTNCCKNIKGIKVKNINVFQEKVVCKLLLQ